MRYLYPGREQSAGMSQPAGSALEPRPTRYSGRCGRARPQPLQRSSRRLSLPPPFGCCRRGATPQPAEEGRAGGCSAAIPQGCPGHGGTRTSAAGRGGGGVGAANNGSRGRGPAAPRPRGGSSAATDPAASGRLPPPLTDNAGRGTGTRTARPLGSSAAARAPPLLAPPSPQSRPAEARGEDRQTDRQTNKQINEQTARPIPPPSSPASAAGTGEEEGAGRPGEERRRSGSDRRWGGGRGRR